MGAGCKTILFVEDEAIVALAEENGWSAPAIRLYTFLTGGERLKRCVNPAPISIWY